MRRIAVVGSTASWCWNCAPVELERSLAIMLEMQSAMTVIASVAAEMVAPGCASTASRELRQSSELSCWEVAAAHTVS